MTSKTRVATVVVALGATFVPASALAGSVGSGAVQADLTQLSSDVSAAQTTLLADLASVNADVTSANTKALKTDIVKFRNDRTSAVETIKSDRSQLKTDLIAAHGAGVTGLAALVRPSVSADRATLRTIRQDVQQTREAVKAFIHSRSGA